MHVNNSAEFIDENPKLSPCGMGKNRHAGNRKDLRGYFIRPFLRREAVLSSRIEGTQTTLGELLAAEAGAMGGPNSADLREVGNYVAAVEYGLERLDILAPACYLNPNRSVLPPAVGCAPVRFVELPADVLEEWLRRRRQSQHPTRRGARFAP